METDLKETEEKIKKLITETEIIISQQALSYRRPFGIHLIIEFINDPITKESKMKPRVINSYALNEDIK